MGKPCTGFKIAGIAAASLFLFCLPAGATTYVLMSDEAIADQAVVIAEVDIVKKLDSRRSEPPVTEYLAIVRQVLKGDLRRSTITVRVPGGKAPDGLELHILGRPNFKADDRALLFLTPAKDDSYGILHLGLGTFKLIERRERLLAVRDLSESLVLSEPGQEELFLRRDYEKFAEWLKGRAQDDHQEADYFESGGPDTSSAPYTLFRFRGLNVRWFEFDRGSSVAWRFRGVGAVGTLPAFRDGLAAWNRESSTSVSYIYGGSTASRNGFTRGDGINALIFGDPNRRVSGRFHCAVGGVIAVGGWWTRGLTGVFHGRTYYRIVEGDIVINDGAECLIRNNRRAAGQVFAHELGHTLGIAHSSDSRALMRPFFHRDGSGAVLRADDVAALRHLYRKSGGGGNPPGPNPPPGALAAPSNLVATSTSLTTGTLTWRDNSSSETNFVLSIKIGNGQWRFWKNSPRNTERKLFVGATPGVTYHFRIRAKQGTATSAWSNTATVTMPRTGGGSPPGPAPPGGLAAPSNLSATATSRTTGTLTWDDNSNNETLFVIGIKIGNGQWRFWKNSPRNSERKLFVGATPGVTYHFRIRAKQGTATSAWSNTATVTMPRAGGGNPPPGPSPPGGLVAPSNLVATATSSRTGRLTWQDNSSNETAFVLAIKVGGGNWGYFATVAANRQSTTFASASPGVTYEFRIRAKRGAVSSIWSNDAAVTMPRN